MEEKFFTVAKEAGREFISTEGLSVENEMEQAIQTVETTKNDFVKGVPRTMIEVIMTSSYCGKLRNKINTLPNASANVVSYERGIFNNTRVNSNVFLSAGVDYIVMVDRTIAQPAVSTVYDPKTIELSKATGFTLFLDLGTKALMEDLIIYKATV